MEPDVDTFAALARSAPWRWRTLHLIRHTAPGGGVSPVEAWVRRTPPDGLVRLPDGREHRQTGRPYASSGSTPRRPAPDLRPDGLVATRDWPGDAHDVAVPLWESYDWVAMLDPGELAHGVDLTDVHRGQRRGRETWWARAHPGAGYDPLCGCCPLLWSAASELAEYGGPHPDRPTPRYPTAYDVALDAQTGVVVAVDPIDGDRRCRLDLTLVEVDPDLDQLLGLPNY